MWLKRSPKRKMKRNPFISLRVKLELIEKEKNKIVILVGSLNYLLICKSKKLECLF